MIVSFKEFGKLPDVLKSQVKALNSQELSDLFIIESDTLELGKHYKLEFSVSKKDESIEVRIRALLTLKYKFLTITPKYFNFFPITELLTENISGSGRLLLTQSEVLSDPELFNSFIKKLKMKYSE